MTAPSVPSLEGIPQAVRVGLTVYVSGMVPVDSAGRIVAAEDLDAQVRQAVTNLNAVVRAARGLPGDVVKVTLYLKDPSPAAIATARAALLNGLDRLTPPALTVVGVASLPEPGMRVMLDATAQLRSEFPDRARMASGDRPQ
ncbi:MAG: RidA family protein [Gemmatimonadota bacterium]